MADSLTISLDAKQVDAALGALQVEAEAQTRPAAQAGAQVFYEEVLRRVPVAKKPVKRGSKTILPGALKRSIYQVFSEDNSGEGKSTYHVSWNAKKAPHGHLVEYGTSRAPAHPFIRPSYDTRQAQALTTAKAKYEEGMRQVLESVS